MSVKGRLRVIPRCTDLIKRLGVFIKTAMGLFEAVVYRIEGGFHGILEFGQGDRSLFWV